MKTIFIKRYPDKGELPDSLRVVTCYYHHDTGVTLAFYNEEEKMWYNVYESDGKDECNEPESWLEEIPKQKPVTENEILNILKHEIILELDTGYRASYIDGYEDAAKIIAELLNK